MPTFIRAASQTLRSGTVLRGLTDDEGKIWLVSADLVGEVEEMEDSTGDSLSGARGRSTIPGADLFPEKKFLSVISIPHLATSVLDTPLAPDQSEQDWLSNLLGEDLSALFNGLSGQDDPEPVRDEESTGPLLETDDAPPMLVGYVPGSPRTGALVPGRSITLDSDADVWIPVDSRTEAPVGSDPWAVIRTVVADTERCETIIGPSSTHPALRGGDTDSAVLFLTPRVMTQALSTPEAVAALSPSVDLAAWRWMLVEALPRALEELAPLRSALMIPSKAMGDELRSVTHTAEALGLTAPALVAVLEMRGSITRTGSALRPWKVTDDHDIITVAPTAGHAMWCPAVASEKSVDVLRTRLALSGLIR